MNEQMSNVDQSAALNEDVEHGAALKMLNLIDQHPDYPQRRLAEAMGVSLGKAHYLLRALFDKGLVKAGRFGRSANKLSYLYRLTPEGLKHRALLTQRFLQQKEAEFERLQREIEALRAALERNPPDRP